MLCPSKRSPQRSPNHGNIIMRFFHITSLLGVSALLLSGTNADQTSLPAQVDTSANNYNDELNESTSDSVLPRDSAAPWPCPYYDSTVFSDQASIQYTIYCNSLLFGSIINAIARSNMDMWQCLGECDADPACKAVTLQPGRCNLHDDFWVQKVMSTGNIAAIKVISAPPAPPPATTSDILPPAFTLPTVTTEGADRTAPPARVPTTIRYGYEYDTGGIWGRAAA
jgi:hypothetical protein